MKRLVRLAIDFEGLLVRFGNVFPDALPMLDGIVRILERIQGRPSGLTPVVVRFGPKLAEADNAGWVRFAKDLSHLGLDYCFQPLDTNAIVVPSVSDLDSLKTEPDARLIFLSASYQRTDEALTEGIESYHVRETGSPDERWVSFPEIPRLIEESLRIPTARPVAPEMRKGGLLAIRLADLAGSRAQALAALRADAWADWATIGRHLILYTENPDLEDSLASKPGIRRLSFSVNKNRLVVQTASPPEPDDLFSDGGMRLRELADGEVRDGAEADLIPWNQLRRRSTPRRPLRILSSPAARFGASEPAIEIREGDERRIRETLEAKSGGQWSDLINEAAGQVPSRLPVDVLERHGRAQAITWQTPSTAQEFDELVAIAYLIPPDTSSTAMYIATALALGRSMLNIGSVLGAFHGVVLDQEMQIEHLLEKCLFSEEFERITLVIEIHVSESPSKADGYFEVSTSAPLAKRLSHLYPRLDDVRWTSHLAGAKLAHEPTRVEILVHLDPGSEFPLPAVSSLGKIIGELVSADN